MNVPEQVRRQAERADELLNQVNSTSGEPEPVPLSSAPEVVTEPTHEPTPAPTPEPTPQPTPAPQQDWEHKYRTLQGVFNAQRSAWDAEKNAFEARIAALEQAARQAQVAQPAAPTVNLTDADVETFGPELVEAIHRQASAIAERIVEQRIAEVKPALQQATEQVQSVARQVSQTADERFFGELAKLVPDWQEVNADSRWLDWLDQADPLSGLPRQAMLNDARAKLDYQRTARMFQVFKTEAGIAAPVPVAAAPVPPAPPVSPRPAGSSTAAAPREPVMTVARSEITQHYNRAVSDRAYRDSDVYKQTEARIQRALAAGQVIER